MNYPMVPPSAQKVLLGFVAGLAERQLPLTQYSGCPPCGSDQPLHLLGGSTPHISWNSQASNFSSRHSFALSLTGQAWTALAGWPGYTGSNRFVLPRARSLSAPGSPNLTRPQRAHAPLVERVLARELSCAQIVRAL